MVSFNGLGISTVQNAIAPQKQQADETSSTDLQDIGQNEFLKLLVAQLQNQDPMNPVENQEFVAQLATFSSLEQLISINKAVSKLADVADTNVPATGNTQNSRSI
ncbi:MAG TPA: flagellar hook capping FlgD N-terminal domain-containing protein [Acidobacteriota bacterium]|nr:flagellar hook capping FlgD N-terminal domain-containing protein [Acidobacteriota bacterium]